MMPLGALSPRLKRGSRLRTVVQFDWGTVRVIEDLHKVHSLTIAAALRGRGTLSRLDHARPQIADKRHLPEVTPTPWIA
jgi:hypothetical protein